MQQWNMGMLHLKSTLAIYRSQGVKSNKCFESGKCSVFHLDKQAYVNVFVHGFPSED